MLSCCRAQFFSDGINGGIEKPFIECLHNELCRDIPLMLYWKAMFQAKFFSEI